jgi:D-alanyl-D-alanine dipeptidase
MKLSEHFTLAELTMSPKATKLKIDNTPTPEHLENLIVLSENVLEPIRAKFGSFSPTSGYRSPKLNAATPGASKTSQHSKGEAVDIDLKSFVGSCFL